MVLFGIPMVLFGIPMVLFGIPSFGFWVLGLFGISMVLFGISMVLFGISGFGFWVVRGAQVVKELMAPKPCIVLRLEPPEPPEHGLGLPGCE